MRQQEDDTLLHETLTKNQDNMNSYLEPVSQATPVTSICLTIIFSIIFLVSTTLNTLFLIIFLRKPSLRNISNRFIVSLTISNLVSSFLLLPIAVADMFIKEWRPSSFEDFQGLFSLPGSSSTLCTAFNVVADFSTSASVFATVLIGFDRFFAITDPLHYHMLVTRCRSWLLIAFGWVLAIFVGAVSVFVNENGERWNVCNIDELFLRDKPTEDYPYWIYLCHAVIIFLFCFLIPFLMLSWSYSKIYSAAQQNSERARRSSLCNANNLEIVDPTKAVSRSSSTRSTSSQLVSHIRRRLSNASLFLYREEARAAKISVGVIILFIFCWFPFYLTKIIAASFGQDHIPIFFYKIVLIFTLLNAAISPYVYMYRSKRIQKEVLRLFGISMPSNRKDFERRRPIYHPLPANLERIPGSPTCLDINFKIKAASPHQTSIKITTEDYTAAPHPDCHTENRKQNSLLDYFRRKFSNNNCRRSKTSDISSSTNSSTYSCPPSLSSLPSHSILKCSSPSLSAKNNNNNCHFLINSATENSQMLTNLLTVDNKSYDIKS